MEQYTLSIIVPMYNAEKYIGTCLDSILNSNLPKDDYEIVIVNDGSKDKGPDIAKKYASKYSNISYYTQENQGQSTARNNGIKSSKGEYVWCVDSDDKVNVDIRSIVETLKTHLSLDIMAFKLHKVTEGGVEVGIECEQPTVTHEKIMKGRDAVIQGYNPSSVCALAIKKEFMVEHNLFFHVGMTHQDVELSYRLFAVAGDVLFTNLVPYVYILHHNSTSQSVNPKKKIKYVSDDCIVIESFTELASHFKDKDQELYDVMMQRIKNIHFGMALNIMRHRKEWEPSGICKGVVDNMRQHNLFPLKGGFGSWKKNLVGELMNVILGRYI